MAMRPCVRCLENRWTYQMVERVITATCQFCGHEVSWQKKEKPMTPERRRQLQDKMRPVRIPNPRLAVTANFVDNGIPPWE